MNPIKFYSGLWPEKIGLIFLYSWVISKLQYNMGMLTSLAIVAGIWFGHWAVRSLIRRLIFFVYGQNYTVNFMLAVMQGNKFSRPESSSYELGEFYLDECVADSAMNRNQVSVAAAWRGIVDYLRGTGQYQVLSLYNRGLEKAISRYRASYRHVDEEEEEF